MEKKKVMIVDDEEDFLSMTKLVLESAGDYEVFTLSTTKDIIMYVHTFNPHVILLDLLMPGIGGLEVCEMLNKDARGKRIPVIVLSALSKDIDKLKAYKLGVVNYLTKPIGKDELLAKIENALRFK